MKWSATQIVQMNTDELIPYDRNSNIHPDSQIRQLANSIIEWGFTVPILIDENNQVIAGHGRLYAAQSIEMDRVPCIVAEGWTDNQKKAYVIADNKLSEGSDWDTSLYFSELKSLNDSGFDIQLTGFDDSILLDFEPNLQPTTNYTDVSESDINKAETTISNNMDRLTGDRSARGTEVMCPYCAETFTFDGI